MDPGRVPLVDNAPSLLSHRKGIQLITSAITLTSSAERDPLRDIHKSMFVIMYPSREYPCSEVSQLSPRQAESLL